MTDSHIQTAGDLWLGVKDTLGPEALGVLQLAVKLFAPDLIDISVRGDQLGQVLPVDIPDFLDVGAESVAPVLEADAKWGQVAREEDRQMPEADLAREQEQTESALAREEVDKLLDEQQEARDEQAADIETMKQRFREAHEDDSPEQRAAHEEQLAAAEELAQQTLAARQEEEREEMER